MHNHAALSLVAILALGNLSACGGGSGGNPGASASAAASGNQPTTVTGASAQLAANGSYVIQNNSSQVALSLPATTSLAVDDTITITGQGAGGWKITQAGGQSILTTAVAGATWTARDSVRHWTAVPTAG